MKKTYINPDITIVKVALSQMIAASTEMGINATGEALEDESSVASRRRGGLWDDEEDF